MELLLADALGVTCQDLVLNLVDGSGNGGQQLLPAHTEVLQEGRKETQGRKQGRKGKKDEGETRYHMSSTAMR